jgi:site-specific DNA-methyltransferase (adenine-specific)
MSNAFQTQIALEAEEQRSAPGNGSAPTENMSDLQQLLAENVRLRTEQWPAPYNRTTHNLHLGDARGLSWIPDSSVHLIVTSPPYWNLKGYNERNGQLGHIADYELFLSELDRVWRECARVLVPGGRICCVVGDVCIPRRKNKGRHWVAPLHSDIQVRARNFGLDNLAPIIWYKIANGATETVGNGSGYYGKPYQPNGVIKNDIEYILFLRQGGEYRKPTHVQKALSMLTKEEQRLWFQQIWTDIRGASTRTGHPAPFPVELASRLIRMFSFAGDTVLDPFLGTGSTTIAAIREGRNSIGNEIDHEYFDLALKNVNAEANKRSFIGPEFADVKLL